MVDFQPGDLVEFIDDKTRGFVVAITDSQSLLVDIEDGLEIPVLKNQVVKVRQSETGQVSNIKKIYKEEFGEKTSLIDLASGLFVAVEVKQDDTPVCLYLINNTNAFYFFTFYRIEKESYGGILKGQLNTGEYCSLSRFKMSELSNEPSFLFWLLPFYSASNDIPVPLHHKFKLDGEKLIKNKKFTQILNAEASLFEITGKFIPEEKTPAKISEPSPKEIRDMTEPEHIIDLHIQTIHPGYKTMTGSEIFHFQIEFFKNSLEKAIALKYKKVIFIHGIGVNTLKKNITELLKHNEGVKSFQDADVRKYGYGALEVELMK